MSLADELTKLEQLRASGAITATEFAQAKAHLLSSPIPSVDHSPQLMRHAELAQLDRAWELERQQYMIADRYGVRHVPSTGTGMVLGVVGGGIGLVWTLTSLSITQQAPAEGPAALSRWAFPLLGLLITGFFVWYGYHVTGRARRYEQAHQTYLLRRTALEHGLDPDHP